MGSTSGGGFFISGSGASLLAGADGDKKAHEVRPWNWLSAPTLGSPERSEGNPLTST